jgi:hypothetical protein
VHEKRRKEVRRNVKHHSIVTKRGMGGVQAMFKIVYTTRYEGSRRRIH